MNKTDLVIYRSPKKQIYTEINFRLCEQKVEPKHHTKYLGVILDEYLPFNEYMNTLKQKLKRANGILLLLLLLLLLLFNISTDTSYQLQFNIKWRIKIK